MDELQRIENQARKDAWGGNLIAVTIAIVDGLELLTGFGPPEDGEALRAGSEQFTGLSGQLGPAGPDDRWRGEASQVYAGRDAALQQLALALAELDTQLASVVNDHGAWVTQVRLGFGILKDLLAVAVSVELAIRLSGIHGPPVALKFAIAVSVGGLGAAAAMLVALTYFSAESAHQADASTTRYTQAFADAAAPAAWSRTPPAVETSSQADNVKVPSSSLLGDSPGAEVSALTAGTQGHRATLTTATAVDPTPLDVVSTAPLTVEDSSAFAPMATTLSRPLTQFPTTPSPTISPAPQPTVLSWPAQTPPPAEHAPTAAPPTGDGAQRAPLTPVGSQPLWKADGPSSTDAALEALASHTP